MQTQTPKQHDEQATVGSKYYVDNIFHQARDYCQTQIVLFKLKTQLFVRRIMIMGVLCLLMALLLFSSWGLLVFSMVSELISLGTSLPAALMIIAALNFALLGVCYWLYKTTYNKLTSTSSDKYGYRGSHELG
jgi:hypothetical protein